jgi:LL-diaminopimelate aminotransferase
VALEETGTVVLPGSAFGPAGEGFFRVALTVGADRLREASRRLGRALTAVQRGELASTA